MADHDEMPEALTPEPPPTDPVAAGDGVAESNQGSARGIDKSLLLARMKEFAQKHLREQPVQRVAEFEQALLAEFPEAHGLTEKLQSGRAANLNLIDWVKADLTRHGEIRYYGPRGYRRLLVFLPCAGSVRGEGLVGLDDAERAIQGLVEFLDF